MGGNPLQSRLAEMDTRSMYSLGPCLFYGSLTEPEMDELIRNLVFCSRCYRNGANDWRQSKRNRNACGTWPSWSICSLFLMTATIEFCRWMPSLRISGMGGSNAPTALPQVMGCKVRITLRLVRVIKRTQVHGLRTSRPASVHETPVRNLHLPGRGRT